MRPRVPLLTRVARRLRRGRREPTLPAPRQPAEPDTRPRDDAYAHEVARTDATLPGGPFPGV